METQKGVGSVSQRNLADYSSGVAIPELFFANDARGYPAAGDVGVK
jgi:hypothetical protein